MSRPFRKLHTHRTLNSIHTPDIIQQLSQLTDDARIPISLFNIRQILRAPGTATEGGYGDRRGMPHRPVVFLGDPNRGARRPSGSFPCGVSYSVCDEDGYWELEEIPASSAAYARQGAEEIGWHPSSLAAHTTHAGREWTTPSNDAILSLSLSPRNSAKVPPSGDALSKLLIHVISSEQLSAAFGDDMNV